MSQIPNQERVTNKWTIRFCQLATMISTWSKDPSTKVGAVIVDPETRQILSTGYNGLPRRVLDNPDLPREEKYALTVHAEMNAILQSSRTGVNLTGSDLYVTWPSCSNCGAAIIQAGIKRVFVPECSVPDRWMDNFALSAKTLIAAGVDYICLPKEYYATDTAKENNLRPIP